MNQAAKLIEVARSYVGYLEKASNSRLEDFKANVGNKNYTVFGQWYGPGWNGQPWCAMFVSFCADKAGIPTSIIPKHASCSVGVSWFQRAGRWRPRSGYTPKPGDIVYFTSNGATPAHVGIVTEVKNGYVYTVEGNTSSGKELEANGGAVAEKAYLLSSRYILGYGEPAYAEDEIARYKAIIQEHCKFSDPAGVFALTDKSPWARDLYRKWAESYR
jgi:hypothetical protein